MSSQRAFNASPFKRDRPTTKMPTTTARGTTECPLCPLRVKAGMRVAKHFESGQWAHLGCVVRLTNVSRIARQSETLDAARIF